MKISRPYSLKYCIILAVLSIIFLIMDIYLVNILTSLAYRGTGEVYEWDYGVGYGYVNIDVSVNCIHKWNYHEWIYNYDIEITSSGGVEPISISNVWVSFYKNDVYLKTFTQGGPYLGCSGGFCYRGQRYAIDFHDNISLIGNLIVKFKVQGYIQTETLNFNITYEYPEPSWFESQGFLLIIVGQGAAVISLIAIIYIIETNKPSIKKREI